MIGNDIVDLALARKQSNWKRKGFLDKIFTQREQYLILDSTDPEVAVWNLWSRKEAAYKIYNRQTRIQAYIPLQLECFDTDVKDTLLYGYVSCFGTTYFTRTEITADYIETVAVVNKDDFERIKPFDTANPVIKTDGIPSYFDTTHLVLRPISKTHHGRYERMIVI